MTEQWADESVQQGGERMKRRGILAAAGAVVAGIIAKPVSQPVAASTAMLIANTETAGVSNSVVGYSALAAAAGFTSQFPVLIGDAGSMSRAGVMGTTTGEYLPTERCGVYGHTFGEPAVFGNASPGVGVKGASTGTGVQGLVTGSTANTVAVQGLNQSTGTGGIGVLGQCNTATGIGVRGISNLGTGVSGTSNGNTGVFGTTTAAGFSALGGIVSTPGTAAFAGTATVPTAFAGFFTGDVFVNGNFTVQDPTRKHGAIAHPDGSYRILYSMESPESWLEDFGKGQLAGGKATITLDPDFAAVMQTDDYHVFLTTYGVSQGLDVTAQSATGFVVQERNNGTSAIRFGYRVVAKPKTTNKATRMATFTVPDIKVPGAGDAPLPAAPPAAPTTPEPPPSVAPPSRPAPPAATPSQGSGTQSGTANPVQPAPPPRP